MANDRSEFLDKRLDYVFSWDLGFEVALDQSMSTQAGFRVMAAMPSPAAADPRLFDVLGRTTMYGADDRLYDVPRGVVTEVRETSVYGGRDGVGNVRGHVVIETDRKRLIALTYTGVCKLQPMLNCDSFFDPVLSMRGKTQLHCRFETADPKYRWLNERAYVAFGEVELGMVRQYGRGPGGPGGKRRPQTVLLDVYMAV